MYFPFIDRHMASPEKRYCVTSNYAHSIEIYLSLHVGVLCIQVVVSVALHLPSTAISSTAMNIADDPHLFMDNDGVVHARSDWSSAPEWDIAPSSSQDPFQGIALELFQMTREDRRARFAALSNAEQCDLIGGVMECISNLSNIITKQNADIVALQEEVHRVRESGSQPGSSSVVHAAESAPAIEAQDEQSTGRRQDVALQEEVHRVRAVSYTHLTLPTNREV